jgi:hypothetical protein
LTCLLFKCILFNVLGRQICSRIFWGAYGVVGKAASSG